MKKCNIICNRYGGHGISDLNLEKIVKILDEYNYQTIINFTMGPKDATRIMKTLEDCDLVLSIGGDGTFSETIAGNIARTKPILQSHLPNGTTNDIASIYGMNKQLIPNLKAILEGKIMEIDVPTINDIPFIYVCGFGKFLNIPYETPQELKKNLGRLSYLIYGFKDFFNKLKSYSLKYTVDGKTHKTKATICIISNSTSVAGFRNFYKNIDLNDSKFEVAMINSKTRQHLFNTMIELVLGGVDNVKDVIKFSANKLEIEFDDILDKKWDIDGEKLGLESKKYSIESKHKISLLIPKN